MARHYPCQGIQLCPSCNPARPGKAVSLPTDLRSVGFRMVRFRSLRPPRPKDGCCKTGARRAEAGLTREISCFGGYTRFGKTSERLGLCVRQRRFGTNRDASSSTPGKPGRVAADRWVGATRLGGDNGVSPVELTIESGFGGGATTGAGSVSFRRGSVGTAVGVVAGGLFGAKAVPCHGDREGGVMASVRGGRLRRMGTASFCDFL